MTHKRSWLFTSVSHIRRWDVERTGPCIRSQPDVLRMLHSTLSPLIAPATGFSKGSFSLIPDNLFACFPCLLKAFPLAFPVSGTQPSSDTDLSILVVRSWQHRHLFQLQRFNGMATISHLPPEDWMRMLASCETETSSIFCYLFKTKPPLNFWFTYSHDKSQFSRMKYVVKYNIHAIASLPGVQLCEFCCAHGAHALSRGMTGTQLQERHRRWDQSPLLSPSSALFLRAGTSPCS